MFAEIAGLDLAAIPDLDRRDIGADRADVVSHGFGEQRAGVIGVADDGSLSQIGRPAIRGGAIDHDAVPGTVRGHHRRTRDFDFLLQRRGPSAASRSLEITWWSSDWRHGAECATTSPMTRMAGPPSLFSTNFRSSSSIPTPARESGRGARAQKPTRVRG